MADRVPAHPWQEFNQHGNTCHYPGCTRTEDEHPSSWPPATPSELPQRQALAVIPLPADALLVSKMISMIARRWQQNHPGKTMTMQHLETRHTQFGHALIIWDEPRDCATGAGT